MIVLRLPSVAHLQIDSRMVRPAYFPDGELYLRVPHEVKGKQVVLVGNTGPSADELLGMVFSAATLSELGAKVRLVIPYFCYARQDHPKNLEACAARAVCALIKQARPDSIVVLQPHSKRVMRWLGAKPASALQALLKALPGRPHMVCAADEGARSLAKNAGSMLGIPHSFLRKKRISPTRVDIHCGRARLDGKTVLLVDDMISTGATLRKAAQCLRASGAKKVLAAVTHNVAGKRLAAFMESAKEISCLVVSDSLPYFKADRVRLARIGLESFS